MIALLGLLKGWTRVKAIKLAHDLSNGQPLPHEKDHFPCQTTRTSEILQPMKRQNVRRATALDGLRVW
jgi:hypothetical protein